VNLNFQEILTKDPSFYKHPSAGPFGEMLHVLRN